MRLLIKWFRRYDALLLVLSALFVALYVRTAGGGFPLDDSWIHQVYGRNLAQTGQWAFIPGQLSAASTSPLYTVLLAAGYALGVNYVFWTHLLGVIALCVTGVVGAQMAARLLPKSRLSGALTGIALVSAWHLIWSAVSGMETMLFSMFTLVLISLAWRELDAAETGTRSVLLRGLVFGTLGALTTLARPEGVGLVGLIGLVMLIVRPHGVVRKSLLWCAAAGVGFGIVIAPYLLLNLQLTGGILPDTAAAKQAQAAFVLATTSFPQRFWQMLEPLVAGGQVLLLPGLVYFAWAQGRSVSRDRRRLIYLLPVMWAVALILLYAMRLPAPFQHGRYVIPTLPAWIVSGMIGSFGLMELGRRALPTRVLTRTLALSALLVFAYFALIIGPVTYARDVRIIEEEMVTTAHWIGENIPLDELLAIHDIGAVGYFAPRPMVDIAGLVTPEMIPIIGDEEATWNLMQRYGARYLMAFPNQVPGGDTRDSRLCRVFTTNNPTARAAGGENMSVYALAWDGVCTIDRTQ